MLELTKIYKSFKDKRVFEKFSLTIEDGEFLGIVGQSGAGKTTLLKIIGMLDRKYEGEYILKIDDKEININKLSNKEFESERNKYFSYVLQENNLFSYLNVYENIEVPFLYKNEKLDETKCDEVLDYLGIKDYKNKKVSLLSGGEKQRVAIARAILEEAPFILADEPTGSLDYDRSIEIIKLLKKISKDYKKTIIVVTHNKDVLDEFDRVKEIFPNE